jgi:phosphatidylserine decarboxylase
MITRYGYDIYFSIVAISVVIVVLSAAFVEPKAFRIGFYGLAAFLFLFSTNFFRDPDRVTPEGEGLIISPADGKVILVQEVEQPEYIGGKAIQVSVFMSPLNVHVNRNPITGVVKHLRYVKGEYFAAYEEKASEKNEQMIIGMENDGGKVLFKQIAGFVARRIVCELEEGQRVEAGDRFGMIKFGSRVDIFFRPDAEVNVKPGDITRAGETVVAVIPS